MNSPVIPNTPKILRGDGGLVQRQFALMIHALAGPLSLFPSQDVRGDFKVTSKCMTRSIMKLKARENPIGQRFPLCNRSILSLSLALSSVRIPLKFLI